jgi:hypothetical protein
MAQPIFSAHDVTKVYRSGDVDSSRVPSEQALGMVDLSDRMTRIRDSI